MFAFGKHRGRPLAEVAGADPGHLRWMLAGDFLADARVLVGRALADPRAGSDPDAGRRPLPTPGEAMSVFHDLRAGIDRLTAALLRRCDRAAASFDGLNDRLARPHATGLFGPTALLGSVVLTRPYAAGFPFEGGPVVQAVLALPGGFGAVHRGRDDRAALGSAAEVEDEAVVGVVPYEWCEPAVRAFLDPHPVPLLADLLGRLGP